jgi:dienelactone hydrolase
MHRLLFVLFASTLAAPLPAASLPGTKELTEKGDLSALMVEGIDKYLMRELEASPERRKTFWKTDNSSPEAWSKSVQPNRERLKTILGVVDERVPFKDLEYVGGPETPSPVAETEAYRIFAVRWPVFAGVEGDGLLLEPKGKVVACIVALPDADWTPEMLAGLTPGVPKESQFARRLAENGCRVVVPTLIDRKDDYSANAKLGKTTNQPHREFIYRMAYEMGRHIIGYEVQKTLAVVDWFTRGKEHPPVGVIGHGEGGLIADYSAQLNPRIKAAAVSGLPPQGFQVWERPIYRNVWKLLPEFDDQNSALKNLLVAPRQLIWEYVEGPQVAGPPASRPGHSGAAPGVLAPNRAKILFKPDGLKTWPQKGLVVSTVGDELTLRRLLEALGELKPDELKLTPSQDFPTDRRKSFDAAARQQRQFLQLVEFTQRVMRDAERVRQGYFWTKLDLSSPEKYKTSCEPLRNQLWQDVIGKLPAPTLPMNPRSRQVYDEPMWKGYEIQLDLYPEVFAYGILLLPKDLKDGEKRPVVVCQHGLEGTPRSCIDNEKRATYNRFAVQLADLGYIVYCPQNPYIGQDKFRVLQRKANPLGLSLFSFIVRQHERTLDWLATLPHVDAEHIAFYGLSYGGKTAMRVPALLPRYCLSICSGDFNEWIWKNVSYDFKGSYMFTGEYEMPEFNLGNTFGYAEMAALIAPRPFMVERGHDDPVGIDEWVALEYAKVRRHYSRLKLADRTEIEFFDGGHVIHGQGTFQFLKKHTGWPK